MHPVSRVSERGNVLFMILIAVALFAALSYAVTSSSRSGNSDVSGEKASVVASQVVQQMNAIKSGVDRLRYSVGCKDSDIDFYSSNSTYYIMHGTYLSDIGIPVSRKCSIYHPDGANVIAQNVPTGIGIISDLISSGRDQFAYTYMPSRAYINNVGRNPSNPTDYDASELIISVNMHSKDVCMAYNAIVGFSNAGDPPDIPMNGDIFNNKCAIRSSKMCAVNVTTQLTYASTLGKHAACVRITGADGAYVANPRYTAYFVGDCQDFRVWAGG
jgi:hypothetical protein